MKTSNVLCLAAACAALAGAASAATISPTGTNFTARGALSAHIGTGVLGCTLTVAGVVAADGSHATINSAAFSGGSICAVWSTSGLPWTATPTSPTAMTISGMSIGAAPLTCTGSVSGSWDNTLSRFTAVNQPLGDCTISMILPTTPALSIAP